MLFKLLKLLGLDVPARMEAVKASLELRAERVAGRIKNVARETAVIAALSALAVAASAMAAGVGLIADAYGEYTGLGVVGGVLVAAAAVLSLVIAFKIRSFRRVGPSDAAGDAVLERVAAQAAVTAPQSPDYSSAPPITPAYPATSASDLVEPLAFLLSRSVRFPRFSSPFVDELIGRLRTTAEGSTDEVIDRAANVIRYGDRANLAFVLGGTVMLGWLLARNSRP